MTSSMAPAGAPTSEATLRPTSSARRVAAWLVDLVIVAALVGVVYLSGLIRIQGCDTFDPDTGTFGRSCPFEQTREVEREDGTIEVVYVLDSGRELPVDHPTVKTVLLGTRVVDPPGPATYLVGLAYVLVVYVLIQGLTGRTPGKLVSRIRLVRGDGSVPGVPASLLRWLVVDGAIGLFGVLMGLVDGPWPLRILAVDAAVGLLGGLTALTSAQGRPGDQLAHTFVVDDREAARARQEAQDRAATTTTSPTASPAAADGTTTTEGADEPAAPAPATVGSTASAASAAAAGSTPSTNAEATPTSWPKRDSEVDEPADEPADVAADEPAGAIALGPVPPGDGAREGDDAHAGHTAAAGGGDPSEEAEPARGAASPIPAPPARPSPTGARPLWGSTTSGVPGRRDPGRFPPPDYEATPPLWDEPQPTDAAATEERSEADKAAPAGDQGRSDQPTGDEAGEQAGAVAAGLAATSPGRTAADEGPDEGPGEPSDQRTDLEEHADSRVVEPVDPDVEVIPLGGPQWAPSDEVEVVPAQAEPASAEVPPAEVKAEAGTATAETEAAAGDDTTPEVTGDRRGEPVAAAPATEQRTGTDTPEGGTQAAVGQQQPLWDEARRAYIFWDRRRQEWLEFDYENQRWGPISR